MTNPPETMKVCPEVERVARAICLHMYGPWDSLQFGDRERDKCRDAARAAIASLRTPEPEVITDAMIEAGVKELRANLDLSSGLLDELEDDSNLHISLRAAYLAMQSARTPEPLKGDAVAMCLKLAEITDACTNPECYICEAIREAAAFIRSREVVIEGLEGLLVWVRNELYLNMANKTEPVWRRIDAALSRSDTSQR